MALIATYLMYGIYSYAILIIALTVLWLIAPDGIVNYMVSHCVIL